MNRQSRFARFADFVKRDRATGRPDYTRMRLEPLEDRKMLTATPLINEIYFDPPGSGGDLVQEYVELRGDPGFSLDNHYLIFLENENNLLNLGNPGMVERIFDLNGLNLGSNGFLTLRQKNNPYTVAPGSTDLVNAGSGDGWGAGATSSLNVSAELDAVRIENSGFTAMLIRNDGGAPDVPSIGLDLDTGNDGLDAPNGHAGWTILDSIGIHSEFGEAEFGRLYAPINFGPESPTNIEPGATFVAGGFEIEYVARYGNSTGHAAADWLVSNLTDKLVAGFTNSGDFRQSNSSDSPFGLPDENNQGVPYGTDLTYSLGSANYPAPAPATVDLNGFGITHPGTGFASTWNNAGAIEITDALESRLLNDDVNLTSLMATISGGPHAGDVLSADTSGTIITASYNAGTGVLSLSGTDTVANYQTVLRTIKYDNTSGNPGVPTVTVNIVATDATSSSVAAVAAITNSIPTTPPEVDLDGPGGTLDFTSSWSNLGATNITDTDATVVDVPGTLVSMTVTLSSPAPGDVLSSTNVGSITDSYNSGTGVLTLSGTDTAANYQTALRSIKYNNTSGGPGAATRTVSIVGNDGVFTSTTAVATINVTSPYVDLNGAPAGTARTVTWSNAGGVAIADAAAALVSDTGNLVSMTATITAANTGGVLSATTSGGITASFNAGTRVLTLAGTASAAAYQTVLRTVKYNNTGTGPNLTSFTVDFVGNDGTSLSNTATGTVLVAVPPVVDLNGGMTATSFSSTWSNLGVVNITDPLVALVQARQSTTLTGITATLASPAAGDVLAVSSATTGVTASYNSGTGVLTLSGTTTIANYQTALRKVTYNNTSGPVNVTSKTVSFVGNDGISPSAAATATITIAPLAVDLNGAAAGTGYTTFWNNTAAVNSESATLATIVDAKAANLSSLTVTISGVHAGDVLTATAAGSIAVSYDSPSHVLTLSGTDTIANYQTVLRSVKYNNTSGGPGVGTISLAYSATDTLSNVSGATGTVQILTATGGVVARNLFYNNSKWDGNNASITASDDGAIAIDKVAYLPGAGLTTFASVSSFTKGITGIMVDIGGTGTHASMTAADFIFKVGNNNTPSTTWTTAPAPAAVSVRAGAGVGGSDRVEIIWNTNDIFRKWLQVVTLSNGNTGLPALGGYTAGYGDVFYFGNAPGDAGVTDTSPNFAVDPADELEAHNHGAAAVPVGTAPTVTNIRDYNRDGVVDTTDSLFARNNATGISTHLKFLNLAVGSPPNAPAGDGGEDAGVASALAAPSTSTTSTSTTWVASSLTAASVDSGSTAAALAQIVAEDSSVASSTQQDEALDALLAEMGL